MTRGSEPERRGAEANVAAALRADRGPGGRYLRLAIVVLALAAGIAAVWVATSRLRAPKRPHEAAEEIDRSHWLAPIKTSADPGGEEVAPFSGFAISVESDPPGALVVIAGVPRGEAPALADVECEPGKPVEIRAEKRGFPVTVTTTTCRRDSLVKLVVHLSR